MINSLKQDAAGRGIMVMHDARGAVISAAANLTTGTATSLIVGDADYLLDIVEMTLANNSSVALGGGLAGVDLINDGTIVRHIDLPDLGTIQLLFNPPLKQITKNTPWNVDLNDITGTTISIGATLVKRTATE